MPHVKYPEAAKLLNDAMETQGVSNSLLAESVKKSPAAISAFRKGYGKPAEIDVRRDEQGREQTITFAETVKAIAACLYPHQNVSSEEADNFAKDLSQAWNKPPAEPSGSTYTLDDLASGRKKLVITSSNYSPFSGSGSLFNRLLARFFDLAGIRLGDDSIKIENGLKTEDHSGSDIVYGLFDSIDRMLRMDLYFWRFPIRIGLGAVCGQQDWERRSDIARLLSERPERVSLSDRPRPKINIKPIVVDGEVGSIHCLRGLKIPIPPEDVLPTLSVPELVNRLDAANENRGASVPVICVDELSALKILQAMGARGCSIFPLNGGDASYDAVRRELPQYYCSLATKRSAPQEFNAFMRDALVQFLSTEIETTSNLWLQLAVALADTVRSVAIHVNREFRNAPDSSLEAAQQWSDAWSWVFYTLHLTNRYINSYSDTILPWKPILRRARQLVQEHIKKDRAMLDSLVELYFKSRVNSSAVEDPAEFRRLSRQIDRLCELLDITDSLRDEDRRSQYYVAQPDRLVTAVENALVGEKPELPIEIGEPHDPLNKAEQEQVAAMKSFMAELAEEYEKLAFTFEGRSAGAGRQAAKTLRKEMATLTRADTRYGGRHGRIIIAREGTEGRVIGGVCITGLDKKQCQFRYLWVSPLYRRLRIGAMMIDKAIGFAKDQKQCDEAFVEVLPDLKDATRLFINKGFFFSGLTKDRRARMARQI
jgi:GNAT superfamily N-acetyltransferase